MIVFPGYIPQRAIETVLGPTTRIPKDSLKSLGTVLTSLPDGKLLIMDDIPLPNTTARLSFHD